MSQPASTRVPRRCYLRSSWFMHHYAVNGALIFRACLPVMSVCLQYSAQHGVYEGSIFTTPLTRNANPLVVSCWGRSIPLSSQVRATHQHYKIDTLSVHLLQPSDVQHTRYLHPPHWALSATVTHKRSKWDAKFLPLKYFLRIGGPVVRRDAALLLGNERIQRCPRCCSVSLHVGLLNRCLWRTERL